MPSKEAAMFDYRQHFCNISGQRAHSPWTEKGRLSVSLVKCVNIDLGWGAGESDFL